MNELTLAFEVVITLFILLIGAKLISPSILVGNQFSYINSTSPYNQAILVFQIKYPASISFGPIRTTCVLNVSLLGGTANSGGFLFSEATPTYTPLPYKDLQQFITYYNTNYGANLTECD